MKRLSSFLVGLGLTLAACLATQNVLAQSMIRRPGDHPLYKLELEPHLLFGWVQPPGPPEGAGFGFGVRATIPLLHNGFVSTINNSVGISFGVDWIHYEDSEFVAHWACGRWVTAPGGTRTCVDVAGERGGSSNYLYFPVAMQWNFWLHERFSVFGEPGLALYYEKQRYDDGHVGIAPVFQIGGRWHFTRLATLTLRLGYPSMSLGVSVMF
ncbi:MAG TPA: hypothetical protein VIV60_05505 [Polyangiaceae bacterium]